MAKAIDNIKAWAKENVQLITILPENTTLTVDTRLKDVLETSVDEKYYLSDEKTALLVAKLEEKDKAMGSVGHYLTTGELDPPEKELVVPVLTPDRVNKRQNGRRFKGDGDPSFTLTSQDRHGVVVGVSEESVPEFEAFILDTKPKDAFRIYKDTCPTLQANDYKEPKQVVEQSGVEYSRKTGIGKQLEVAHCLSAWDWRGLNRNQAQTAVAEVKQLGNVNPSGRGMNGAVYDINAGLSPTLTTDKGEGQRIAEAPYYRIRKLTPLECFRLQSFPDWAFHEAAEVNSNSQLYRQAGNSVTVNVIHEIAKRL